VTKTPYQEWRERTNCTHGHCPNGCDKPMPIKDGENMICSWCSLRGVVAPLIPCVPGEGVCE
jgi:hypothetical protein